MSTTMIATIGFSNGGKTTWGNLQKTLLNVAGYTCEIVCRDDIRQELYGERYDPAREHEVSAEEEIQIAQLVAEGVDYILVTNCHHKREYRDRLRRICDRYGCELTWQIIDTPVEECIRRAEAKGDDYIIPVIRRQAQEGKIPDPNCVWCGGDELYWQHSPDCDNDMCGLLNPHCEGESVECSCNILATTEEEL